MKSLPRKILLLCSVLACLCLAEACGKIDRDYEEATAFKVLVLGNSFSRDAFSYSPWIMENVSRGVKLDIEILYVGGAGLSTHIRYINENSNEFIHDIFTSRTHTWGSFPEMRASDVVGDKDWDLIVLQDGTGSSRDYSQVAEHINTLKEYFAAVLPDSHPEYAMMMIPARPDGTSALGDGSSAEDYGQIAQVASEVLGNGLVDYVIPCGTAIQHARKSSLDSFGEFGHMSYDGRHLQEGIPCQTSSYVVAQSLINAAGRSGSIDDCTIKADSKWIGERYIPGKHGRPEKATDVQYELTKYCARMAMEKPFSLEYNEFKDHYPSLFAEDRFILEAHRGFSSMYPENSIPAFEAAGKEKAYLAIETDVQSTKDGVLVCMHDSSLERTTDGSGEVRDYTYAKLQKLFLTGGTGWNDEYTKSLRIPTFEEFLDICVRYGKIPYVELKVLSADGIKAVIDMLHSKGFQDDRYVLTSFSSENLARAAKICDAPLEFMQKSFTEEEVEYYAAKKNYTVRPVAEEVTGDFVERCHALGMFVEVWNISTDRNTASKMLSTGIDGGTCNGWDIGLE